MWIVCSPKPIGNGNKYPKVSVFLIGMNELISNLFRDIHALPRKFFVQILKVFLQKYYILHTSKIAFKTLLRNLQWMHSILQRKNILEKINLEHIL